MAVIGESKSGINAAALADNASKQIVDIDDYQKFQVTEVIITNAHGSTVARVRIFDEAAGTPTATAQVIPDIFIAPEDTVRIEFTDGPIFETEVSAELEGGNGTVDEYHCMVDGVLI